MTSLATYIANAFPLLAVTTDTRGNLLTKYNSTKIGIANVHRELRKLGVLAPISDGWRQSKKDELLVKEALHSMLKDA